MIAPAQLARLARINRVLIKHGLDELAFSAPWLRPFRLVYYLSPWNWLRRSDRPRGQRLRMALEELGPVFVKFGQVLSTRRDVLPPDIADELARLQDDVPPFPGADARALVEAAHGRPIEAVFAAFEDRELASASLAQVHAATLRDGREVVVKVLRPGVESIIDRDIGLMYRMARLVERYWPEGERLHPVEVVTEYEEVIRAELDLMREGANATMMRRNFEAGSLLYVPYVVWELTTANVMVMERIGGIPIRDLGALQARGVSFRQLAERGVEIFFTQVFRHNFFHADMHPGNLFVDARDPERPTYIAVDFGIVGTLTDRDQHYLAHNLLAFFNRDYRRVAELHVESGWVPEDTRVEQFEAAIRTVCEPIFNRPLKEISFGQFLLRLFQTARRFNVEVQPQLILLQKTLLNVEGMGRELYPDLDLWATAKPTLERWMREQVGLPAVIQRVRTNLPEMMETLPDLPVRLSRAVDRLEASDARQRRLEERLLGLEESRRGGWRRGYAAIAGAGLLIAAAVLLGTGGTLPPAGPQDWLGVILGSVALVVLAVGARR